MNEPKEARRGKAGLVSLNAQMLAQIEELLNRTRKRKVRRVDCARWTIIWTVLNAHENDLPEMESAIVAIDLEGRRQRM